MAGPPLDGRAVAMGAGTALLIGAPMAVIAEAVAASTDDTPGWVGALAVVVLAGFAAGGYVAGSKRPDLPMMHGALAAVTAFVVVQTLGIILIASRGDELRPVAYVFNAMLATALGIIGGLVADRRHTRAHQ